MRGVGVGLFFVLLFFWGFGGVLFVLGFFFSFLFLVEPESKGEYWQLFDMHFMFFSYYKYSSISFLNCSIFPEVSELENNLLSIGHLEKRYVIVSEYVLIFDTISFNGISWILVSCIPVRVNRYQQQTYGTILFWSLLSCIHFKNAEDWKTTTKTPFTKRSIVLRKCQMKREWDRSKTGSRGGSFFLILYSLSNAANAYFIFHFCNFQCFCYRRVVRSTKQFEKHIVKLPFTEQEETHRIILRSILVQFCVL